MSARRVPGSITICYIAGADDRPFPLSSSAAVSAANSSTSPDVFGNAVTGHVATALDLPGNLSGNILDQCSRVLNAITRCEIVDSAGHQIGDQDSRSGFSDSWKSSGPAK